MKEIIPSFYLVNFYVIKLKMDTDKDLILLLTKWNLQHLYELFKSQMIDFDVLKILKPHHISKLFQDFSIGEQAKFENNLEMWKKEINIIDVAPNFPISMTNNNTNNKRQDVMDILTNTSNGKDILKFYTNNKTLYEEQRNLLINTITKYMESKNIECSLADCSEIEKQICHIFPTEKLEFYTNGKRGKIYNKLANYKRLSRTILKVEDTKEIATERDEDYALEMECLRSSNISQDELNLYWQKCAPLRFKQIANSKDTVEIFKLWPEYAKPSGYLLIDIDFVLKFPMARKLHERWQYFSEEILCILKSKISCSLISKKLHQIETTDEESKIFATLWYCHNLFPPQLKINTDENGAKYRKKFTILDSQESFAIVAGTVEELDAKIKLLKIQCRNIQPKLLVIGDIFKIKEIYVYFDNLKYPFVSVLKAFDLLFKIIFVFNLQYPSESEIFYHFIQDLFYDIGTNKKCTKSSSIKHEIMKLKN